MASIWSRATNWLTKAAVPAPVSSVGAPSPYGAFLTPQHITPYQAWLLYCNISTLAKVVDTIADETARLAPLVFVNGEPVKDHPIAGFLKRPGFNRTRQRFIKELAIQYLVTGTAYMHIIGQLGRGPVALDVLKSKAMNIFPGHDMWPEVISYSEGTRAIRFAKSGSPRDPRYIDEASMLGEVVSIYDAEGDYRGVGLSRLNAIKVDVDLRLKGMQHNTSLLDNGARLSGILSFKDAILPEQERDSLNAFMSRGAGPQNAGRVLVTSGGALDFQQLSQNAKDMDFAKLVQIVEDAIVSRYSVPVTLFRPEAQTNNNYEVAWQMLYEQAVLPCFDVIYAGLAQVMSERLGADIEIKHDALTNAILARQASARAREMFQAALISRNEARELVGYEPVLGGDTIYGPMGEVPVAEDYFTEVDERLGRSEFDERRRIAIQTARGKEPGGQEGEEQEDETDTGGSASQAKPAKPEKGPGSEKAFKSIGALLGALGSYQFRPTVH